MARKWYYMIGAGILTVTLSFYKWIVKYLRAKVSYLETAKHWQEKLDKINVKANAKYLTDRKKRKPPPSLDPDDPWDGVRSPTESDPS